MVPASETWEWHETDAAVYAFLKVLYAKAVAPRNAASTGRPLDELAPMC